MFENHQQELETLLQDKAFRRLYEKHQKLDEEIAELERLHGLDHSQLTRMKMEKLNLRDQLTAMMTNLQPA